MGACCSTKKDPELFVTRKDRWCTDILFLLAFLAAWGGGIAIAAVSINKDTSLLTDILYTPDSYGNNCGRPNTATADMKKVFYPNLDADINKPENLALFATGRYWEFKPTRMCASDCPGFFNFENPTAYGGSSYPCGYDSSEVGSGEVGSAVAVDPDATCTAGGVPEYYYTWVTQDIINRCVPFSDSATVGSQDLCSVPSCTEVNNASLAGSVHCTQVDAYPSDTPYAWEVCGEGTVGVPVNSSTTEDICTAQTNACKRVLRLTRSDLFKPTTQTADSEQYTQDLANYVRTVLGGIEGLMVTEAAVCQGVFGIAMPVVLGFVWAIFLWWFAGPLVWGLLVGLLLLLTTATFFFMYKAGWFGDTFDFVTNIYNSSLTSEAEDNEKTWYAVIAVITGVVTAIFLVFFIMSRKAIKRLIAIVQEATKVFKDLAAIVLWPVLFQLPFMLAVFFYGLFVSYYIIMVWSDVNTMAILLILHVFLILWTLQVIKATIWSSMSAAVGVWFTTTNAAENADKRGCFSCGFGFGELWNSTGLILAKHLGSMCFGALIIAVCMMLRLILATIDYYTQDLQEKNMMLKMVMKCSQCVMWCLQKTIEFISFFGFIFVAIKGVGFCKGCVQTFVFIAKYTVQTAVNKTVQSLLRALIGYTTPVFCALMTFFVLDSLDAYKGHSAYWPAAVVFVGSFIIADGICTVYDCIIDTIYLMSFEDMERPGGPKYMSNDLRKGFGMDEAENEASKAAGKYKPVTQRRKEVTTAYKSTTVSPDGGGSSAV